MTWKQFRPWLIWGLGAAFFFAEYFARVAPSVMVPHLMRTFNVGALSLGALSAYFYYPYVGMQVPVGTLMDYFGPHKLLTFAAVVCGGSCLLFAVSESLWVAEMSRFVMGFSAAFAFVGALKLATLWFKPSRLGLLAGLTQGLGMLGAAVGEGPVSVVVAHVGWRYTMILIGSILLSLSVLIFIFVSDKNVEGYHHHGSPIVGTEAGFLDGLYAILKSKYTWINAIFVGLLYAPTAAFAELWGVSYLVRTYGFQEQIAATGISFIFIGWALGSPLWGWVSDRMGRRKPLMIISALLSLVFMSLVLYLPAMPIVLLFACLFLYGISNTGVAISYAVGGELHPRRIAGVSIAFTNMASVLLGACFQPIIGGILDAHWDGHMVDGIPYYSAAAFRIAMATLPICLVIAVVVVLFLRETYCRGPSERVADAS
ncbi:MAG TPA: MFS transporter [Coxiellaceae bacterium]|nr:MFS transporter [Coxiellaceae bacterium]